jgi:hypothetical protein
MTGNSFEYKREQTTSLGLPESSFDHACEIPEGRIQSKAASVRRIILLVEVSMTIPIEEQDKSGSK